MGYISMSGHTGYMVFELFWPEKGIILTLLVYNKVYFFTLPWSSGYFVYKEQNGGQFWLATFTFYSCVLIFIRFLK